MIKLSEDRHAEAQKNVIGVENSTQKLREMNDDQIPTHSVITEKRDVVQFTTKTANNTYRGYLSR